MKILVSETTKIFNEDRPLICDKSCAFNFKNSITQPHCLDFAKRFSEETNFQMLERERN